MEAVLWHVLGSSRGGANRCRIIRAVRERPRNANELAEELEIDYTTVRHHLDVLQENKVVEQATEGYGAVYTLTDMADDHDDVIEDILDTYENL